MLKGRSLSHRFALVSSIALLALIAAVVPEGAQARDVSISIGSNGRVETGVIPEPADCLGPLNAVFFEVLLFLADPVAPVDTSFSLVLDAGWEFIPDSCTANLGQCQIIDASNLTWSGMLTPAQPLAAVDFAARVVADVPVGTILCGTFTAQFGTDPPITDVVCEEVNSARQCGLGAPTVSSSALGVLVVLLFATGVVLVRRRA